MAYKWYPIDPARNADGVFAALAHLPENSKYKPNPKPARGELTSFTLSDDTEKLDYTMEVSALGALGVVGSVSASASAKTLVIIRDVAAYDQSKLQDPAEWCRLTKWGVGYRLILLVSDLKADFDADAKWAAVAGEVGLANVSFEIRVFGFADRDVLSKFPILGRFDSAAYDALQEADKSIRQYIVDNRVTLAKSAVPFQVVIEGLPGDVPDFKRARSRLFAMDRISRGKSRQDAEREAEEKELLPGVVQEVYGAHGALRPDDRKTARAWLEKTSL